MSVASSPCPSLASESDPVETWENVSAALSDVMPDATMELHGPELQQVADALGVQPVELMEDDGARWSTMPS